VANGSRSLRDQLIDIAVYAPLGVLTSLRQDLPAQVQAGRDRAEQRVQLAKMIGQMAVAYGRVEVAKRVAEARVERGGGAVAPAAPAAAAVVTATAPPTEPFAGYDELNALDIVQRLCDLDRERLMAVRAYEAANRARRTVLGKVEQRLQLP
jgi:hypothetical protein